MTDCKTISELLGASRSRSVPLGANWPQATSQERLGASHTNKKASRRGGGGVGARCTERAVRSIWDAQTRKAAEEEEEDEEEEEGGAVGRCRKRVLRSICDALVLCWPTFGDT